MDKFNNLNILITGGCGFIGTNLILDLSNIVNKIIVIDNLSRGCKKYIENIKNVEIITEDLTDINIAIKYINNVDIVYHLADIVCDIDYAYNNQYYIYKQNILINSNVLSACLKNNIKNYIYVGTACSYPKEKQLNKGLNYFSENEIYPLDPETSYGMSKYLGEYEAGLLLKDNNNNLNIGILRLHNVYGPYCSYNINPQVIPTLIKKIIYNIDSNLEVWGSGDQYRDFIYIDDVINALKKIFIYGMNKGAIQVGSGKHITIKNLCNKLLNLNKKYLKKNINITFNKDKLQGDYGRLSINSKAENILNWFNEIEFDMGLEKTFVWMLNNIDHKYIITSPLASIPTRENLSDTSKGGLTGVTTKGSFRNEKHTGCGNVMFQIASIYGLAWDNNYVATFPTINTFYEILKHKNFNNDNIYRKVNTFNINIKNKISIGQGYHKVILKNNLNIESYFNCYKYFHKYRDRILDLFSIDSKSINYINNKYNFINESKINISLHIRRGDFVLISDTWNKEYLLNDDYYYNSLKYIDKIIKEDYNLLVFSDDINYCKEKLNFAAKNRNIIYIENNLDYIDLWLMSLCDHNIINKSTFSWWSAYLNNNNNKIIIAPKINIFCEKRDKDKLIKTFYFDNWIII